MKKSLLLTGLISFGFFTTPLVSNAELESKEHHAAITPGKASSGAAKKHDIWRTQEELQGAMHMFERADKYLTLAKSWKALKKERDRTKDAVKEAQDALKSHAASGESIDSAEQGLQKAIDIFQRAYSSFMLADALKTDVGIETLEERHKIAHEKVLKARRALKGTVRVIR